MVGIDSGFTGEHIELFERVSSALTRRTGDRDYAQMLALDAFHVAWHRAHDEGAEITFASLLSLTIEPAATRVQEKDARTARQRTAAGAIASLRMSEREILRMIYWDQLSMAELAEYLECTIGQAGRRLARAYRKAERLMLKWERESEEQSHEPT